MKTYAMGWVLEYQLSGAGYNIYIHQKRLSDREIANLEHHYCPDLDDPYIMFPDMESAERAAKKYRTDWIRVMTYSTPDPATAKKYCVIKDKRGNPIPMEDFLSPTKKNIASHEHTN